MKKDRLERFILLAEEASEVSQAVCKIIRHGKKSWNPLDPVKSPNIQNLEKELGHVLFAIDFLCRTGDIDRTRIDAARARKEDEVPQWLRYNEV